MEVVGRGQSRRGPTAVLAGGTPDAVSPPCPLEWGQCGGARQRHRAASVGSLSCPLKMVEIPEALSLIWGVGWGIPAPRCCGGGIWARLRGSPGTEWGRGVGEGCPGGTKVQSGEWVLGPRVVVLLPVCPNLGCAELGPWPVSPGGRLGEGEQRGRDPVAGEEPPPVPALPVPGPREGRAGRGGSRCSVLAAPVLHGAGGRAERLRRLLPCSGSCSCRPGCDRPRLRARRPPR